MKVSIVGAGNSGCAHACKLIQCGHEVTIIKTSESLHNENYETIKSRGYIECIDHTDNLRRSLCKPASVTKDLEKGLSEAEVILILTQSLQHKDLAQRLSKYFKDGQLVLIIPGNLGSVMFKKQTTKNVIFAEGESTPYDARITEPGKVEILFKNVRNAVSFYSKSDEIYLSTIDSLFGRHKYLRSNLIESAMHNPNLIVHTIGTIMSANRIEKMKGDFWMYRESFSPSIWNLIEELDEEKKQVIKAYGGQTVISYLDAYKWRNEENLQIDSLDVFNMYANTGGPKGPASLETRYVHEDVPMGLCLLENLAKMKGISTPISSSLISIASSLVQRDFRLMAYSLEDLSSYIDSMN